MSQIQVGNDVINRATVKAGTNTVIDLNTSCPDDGVITQVTAWAANTISSAVVGTFELVSGSTYRCIDSFPIGTISGGAIRTFDVNLKANAGCFIGLYWPSGNLEMTASGNYVQSAGDNAIQGDESSYTAQTGTFSILGIGWNDSLEIDVDVEYEIGVQVENNIGVVTIIFNGENIVTPNTQIIESGEQAILIAPVTWQGRTFVQWKVFYEDGTVEYYIENEITLTIDQPMECRAIYIKEMMFEDVIAVAGDAYSLKDEYAEFECDVECVIL